jgi:hypothetical protein
MAKLLQTSRFTQKTVKELKYRILSRYFAGVDTINSSLPGAQYPLDGLREIGWKSIRDVLWPEFQCPRKYGNGNN